MKQALRIAYLSSSTIVSDSANSIHVMRMSDALTGLGHEVELHALVGELNGQVEAKRYYGTSNHFKIHCHNHKNHIITNLLRHLQNWLPISPLCRAIEGALFVKPIVKRNDTELLYSRNPDWLLVCARHAQTVIFEIHQPPSKSYYKWVYSRIFELSNLATIVVISEALKAELLRLYPRLNPKKVLVAHDAAVPVAHNSTTDSCDRICLGYIGHLYPGRGLTLMLQIARSLPQIDLHIVGGSEKSIRDLLTRDLPKNVFLHGHVAPSELASHFSKMDILLAPYQRSVTVKGEKGNTVKYMSPLKIFEYMSSGKPMVVSDLPVLHEVLVDESTAVFAEPDSLTDWLEKIQDLIADDAKRRRIGQNALTCFQANYTWSSRANSVIKFAVKWKS